MRRLSQSDRPEKSKASADNIRVSVIVPVYRPGPSFDDLIASLDRQTLGTASLEVLLCDDGSGEPTGARLAAIARDRPHVRVLSLEHSGWPGMPRNHGVDAARGTYVQFVDQDDYLFDGALEKLCDYADQHSSDVIVGKEVGIGRRLPSRIFSHDVPDAVLGTDPLLEMLTPHKMFRTSFLRANGIRFPEGKVRLEDHLFVMQAYFAASTISILASEPCYAWVKEPGSASSSRIDPESYFPHLETVLDLVEAHTEPGKLRDRLLRHWFRGKILKRLSGRQMARYPDDYRDRLLDVVTPLVQKKFGPGVDAGLGLPHRIRASLLRADRREDLLALAQFEAGITCHAAVTEARWSRGGGLHLTLRVTLTSEGHDAFVFETTVVEVPVAESPDPDPRASVSQNSVPRNSVSKKKKVTRLISLPVSTIDGLPETLLVADRELRNDRVDLFLTDGETGAERRIGGRHPRNLDSARVSIDPVRVFGPDDESRGGALTVKVRRAGWTFETPLVAAPAVLARAGKSPLLAGRNCTLAARDDGTVELRREWPGGRVKDFAGRAVRRVRALARRR
ncbi:glycosyltransferase family A protein [Microbacterium sp. STF-2]|uniref:glycosyltransferase family 2 protein n=1 Tax=Microbacterium sp. STF-2 TaxID=3031132 RepID=UPI002B00274A|nr:glycosyltransferase family A protein [Microbacterium sp. STF-2]MEA1265104.1 glycosyltransferase family A protein [Microbacterium sp. STF-2]